MKYTLLILVGLLLSLPAAAEEYIYQKPECEFTVTFPGEVYQSERCSPDIPDECQILTSYTRVFDMRTSMNFKLTCNAVKEDMLGRYSGDVMKTTLTALARTNKVDEYETFFNEGQTLKQAALVGTGKSGVSDKLYMVQMWIGTKSILVLEGELIGQHVDEYEEKFASVLSSIRPKKGAGPDTQSDQGNAQDKDSAQNEEKTEAEREE